MAIKPTSASLRRRLGFGARILIAFVIVLALTQLATLSVVGYSVDRNVHAQLGQRLEVGQRVWGDMAASRATRFEESVAVLAGDFAFREALATGDAPTVLSALANHGQRVGADVALLLDTDGSLRTATRDVPSSELGAAMRPMLAQAARGGSATTVAMLDGRVYQLALVPVMAPRLIGWVAMGTGFDDDAVRQFKSLTGLDAAIVVRDPRFRLMAATLPAAEANELLAKDAQTVHGRVYMREFGANGDAGDHVRIALMADTQAAMRPFRLMQQRIVLLAAAAALLVLLLAYFLGRRVSRPVERLASAARRIGSGDYRQPLQVSGNDELSDLATAFNRMQGDIAEREARISHQANHDGLTDLPNRAFAMGELDRLIDASRRSGAPCAVLMLDLDRFKEINDTLGHAFGDEVLAAVASRLQGGIRQGDVLARMGGDEFLVILSGAARGVAAKRAQLLIEAMDSPFVLTSTQINLDASIGIAAFPEHATDATTLLRRADIAMYQAKQDRTRIATYQPGHDERHMRQIALMGALKGAAGRGELHVAYQPKVVVETQQVAHVEALLRWRHPEFGNVPPDEFIPLAERSGIIQELTRFVLDRALREAGPWIRERRIRGVAVNLSAMELIDAGLPDHVGGCLRQHAVEPGCLVLEVTETTVMRDLAASLETMGRLRSLGIRLSIDDFGTGHSSLAQLHSLPVQEIKIDKSFILDLSEADSDSVIVRSAIEIGHNMGLSVIAEGVEHRESLELLRALGCDMVQGYLFTPPLVAADFVAWHDRYRDVG